MLSSTIGSLQLTPKNPLNLTLLSFTAGVTLASNNADKSFISYFVKFYYRVTSNNVDKSFKSYFVKFYYRVTLNKVEQSFAVFYKDHFN